MQKQIIDSIKKNRIISIEKDSLVVEWIRAGEKISDKIKTKIKVAAGVKVNYVFLLDQKFQKNFLEKRIIEAGTGAKIKARYCYLGGKENKIELNYKIGAKAGIDHKTIFLAQDKQIFSFKDNYEFLDLGSDGQFVINGLVRDQAQARAISRITVGSDGNKTKAKIEMELKLASLDAKGSMSPELDINNSNVKTEHSARVSHLNPGQLFYLRSRGLSKAKIEKILTKAIFEKFASEVEDENVSKEILKYI